MSFRDLGDWFELGGLALPIQGKTYTLPAVSAELGPRLQAVVSLGIAIHNGKSGPSDADRVVLDDAGERDLYREILHPCEPDDVECPPHADGRCPHDVFAEMVADGVPWAALKHAAMTSMFDAVFDRETAERFWESPGKAPAPANRAQRRASKPTAAEIKAKKPASTGTTTSRRSTAKARATGGRKSSGTGR